VLAGKLAAQIDVVRAPHHATQVAVARRPPLRRSRNPGKPRPAIAIDHHTLTGHELAVAGIAPLNAPGGHEPNAHDARDVIAKLGARPVDEGKGHGIEIVVGGIDRQIRSQGHGRGGLTIVGAPRDGRLANAIFLVGNVATRLTLSPTVAANIRLRRSCRALAAIVAAAFAAVTVITAIVAVVAAAFAAIAVAAAALAAATVVAALTAIVVA
jgi:hypothetical protein